MNDVMLSIYVATYNHEKYITQALDSILMQKTKYSYEVLVGEDASTDNTREVLKAYEKEHPGKFNIFYREQNMSKMEIGNAADLRMRCIGKYIIALEGDDFWTDENKLEKQISFLETHPEYNAVAHNCVVVGEDSQPNGEEYPECKDQEYTLKHYMHDIMPGQLTTVMMRNYMVNPYMDNSFIEKNLVPGDRRVYFSLIANGRVYCMQEKMSAYRHITTHGSSYSATVRFDRRYFEKWNRAMVEYAYQINNKEAIWCAEALYARNLLTGILKRDMPVKEIVSNLKLIRYKGKTIVSVIKIYLRRLIIGKKLK